MDELRIVIPSHKRAERVFSKYVVDDPIICVAKSQREEYKRYNPDCEIVTHPDDVVGLVPKRNWMAKHFGDLFMLDDDVVSCKRMYIEKGETGKVREKSDVRRIITELWELAKMTDCHVFGFTNKFSPMMYDENEFLCFDKMITGCSYGVIRNKNVWWNEDLKLKEDFWISCYMKYKERKILTDLRYWFEQKDTFVNPGGLSAIRSQEEERRNIMIIRKHFGDSINLKTATNNGKDKTIQKVQYNISVKFKF